MGSLDLNAVKWRCGSGENPTPPLSHTTSPRFTLSPTSTRTLPALMCTYSTNRSPPDEPDEDSPDSPFASVPTPAPALVPSVSSWIMTLFHLNKLLTATPVSVFAWLTSTTVPAPTANSGVPSLHLKSTAWRFPLKKCVRLPPSPCVHSHGPGEVPSVAPSGNPSTRGCSSSGAGCTLQSCTSLSISEVGSVSVAACTIVFGGTKRMKVTQRRVFPSLSVE